ncbi:hypothetical protein H6P81_020372 [Aristolochia fimbriata]|uniref:Uncharacterized protein n=1 Tax=Aristolochia fimbriata TaxID=158543 RepID=A0AAV7DXH3_ARIFI|nr:hypothetical protein H6P81_020372 [Aristolochia fimbriata]
MWIYFPLNIKWESQALGVFDDILNERYVFRYVEGDALVPDEVMKNICKRSLRLMVKNWRRNLKKKYDKKDEEARKICPDSRLTQAEWELLMKYWAKPKVIESFKINKINRSHLQMTHTLGSKSIARHYVEERKRLGDDSTVLGSYLSAHRKKDGSYSNDYTRENCVETRQTLESRCTCNRKWEIAFAWNKLKQSDEHCCRFFWKVYMNIAANVFLHDSA